jgi:hypothetical protein
MIPHGALSKIIIIETAFLAISNFRNKSDRPLTCKRDKFIVFTNENINEKHRSIIIDTHGSHLSVRKKITKGLDNAARTDIPQNIKTAHILIYFR